MASRWQSRLTTRDQASCRQGLSSQQLAWLLATFFLDCPDYRASGPLVLWPSPVCTTWHTGFSLWALSSPAKRMADPAAELMQVAHYLHSLINTHHVVGPGQSVVTTVINVQKESLGGWLVGEGEMSVALAREAIQRRAIITRGHSSGEVCRSAHGLSGGSRSL